VTGGIENEGFSLKEGVIRFVSELELGLGPQLHIVDVVLLGLLCSVGEVVVEWLVDVFEGMNVVRESG
jgi:hypothetical protein